MSIKILIFAFMFLYIILLSVNAPGETFSTKGFQDVTDKAEIGFESIGGGAAFGDYDNDGDLDLFLANRGPNVLYQNNGNGTFTDVTEKAGVKNTGQGFDALFFDYDNDGDLDLYVANWGPNILYQNNGDGTFIDVTQKAGVGDAGNAWSVVALDYDMDGWLDIYIGNGMGSRPNVLYHNNKDGTFLDVSKEAGVDDPSDSIGVCVADYDNDGDPDIYVGNWGSGGRPNQGQPDKLYRNEGNGRFTDVADKAGVADRSSPNATIFFDYDNDGNMDIFLANEVEADVLYHNNSDGTFTNVSKKAGIEGVRTGFGAVAFDYDNDGDLDLCVVNVGKNVFYENNGNSTFSEISKDLEIAGGGEGQAAAVADYDNDGDLDLYVINGYMQAQQNVLYQNTSRGNNWLFIKLEGTKSNRNGIGARVTVQTGNRKQARDIIGGSGYASQNTLFAEFGLGVNSTAEKVEVRWPSGQVDVLTDVPANQAIVNTEGKPGYRRLYTGKNFAINSQGKQSATWGEIKLTRVYQNYPNPLNPETWIPYELMDSADVTVQIYTESGQRVRILYLGHKEAGSYLNKSRACHWDGRNDAGELLASGIYFYSLRAGDFTEILKMIILK
jgi:hypothetical protein